MCPENTGPQRVALFRSLAQQGPSSDRILSLLEDAQQRLWIGTYGGGLNAVQDGQIAHYSEDTGLFDDVVSCILEDRAGRLWLSAQLCCLRTCQRASNAAM